MFDKKSNTITSPDHNKLQAVVIDRKTTIFIQMDKDPDEARRRYAERHAAPTTKIA